MAFERLGIELVVKGANDFARDLAHITMGLSHYVSSIQKAARASESAANREIRAHKNRVAKVTNSINRSKISIKNYTNTLSRLNLRLNITSKTYKKANEAVRILSMSIRKSGNVIANEALSINQLQSSIKTLTARLDASQKALRTMNDIGIKNNSVFIKAEKANRKLSATILKQKESIVLLVNAQKNIIETSGKLDTALDKEEKSYLALITVEDQYDKTLGKLNDSREKNAESSAELTKLNDINIESILASTSAGSKFIPVISGIVLGLDLFKAGLNIVINAAKVFGRVLKTIFDAVKKVTEIVLGIVKKLIVGFVNLGKSIAKGFVSVVKIALSPLRKFKDFMGRIFEIALGMTASRIFWRIGEAIRSLSNRILQAASEFQLLDIRLQGLIRNELITVGMMDIADATDLAVIKSKELFDWMTRIAIKTPFGTEAIANVLSLAKAYGFTIKEAKSLTLSVIDFSAGMGLQDDAMRKIIENFGQLIGQGKLAGTELRDLGRGAFLPIGDLLDRTAEKARRLGVEFFDVQTSFDDFTGEEIITEIKGSKEAVDLFIESFQEMTSERFAGAAERLSNTWATATGNVGDFIDGVLGFRVLGPPLAVVSQRMNDFVDESFSPKNLRLADRFGKSFASIAKGAFKLSDAITKSLASSSTFAKLKGVGGLFTGFVDTLAALGESGTLTPELIKGVDKMKKSLVSMGVSTKTVTALFGRGATDPNSLFGSLLGIKDRFLSGELDFGAAIGESFSAIKDTLDVVYENDIKPAIDDMLDLIIVQLETFWNEKMFPFITDNVIPWLKELGQKMLDWAVINAPLIGKSIADTITGSLASLVTWFTNMVGEDSPIVKFLDLLGSVGEVISAGFGLATVDSGIDFDPVSGREAETGAQTAFETALQELKIKLITILDEIKTAISEKVTELWESLLKANPEFEEFVGSLERLFGLDNTSAEDIFKTLNDSMGTLSDIFGDAGLWVGSFINLVDAMKNLLLFFVRTTGADIIFRTIVNILEDLFSVNTEGNNMAQIIFDITEALAGLLDFMQKNLTTGGILKILSDFFTTGRADVTTDTSGVQFNALGEIVGGEIATGIVTGVDSGAGDISEKVNNMFDFVGSDSGGDAKRSGGNLAQKFVRDGLIDTMELGKPELTTTTEQIFDTVDLEVFANAGNILAAEMINGIIVGIANGFSAIVNALHIVIQAAVAAALAGASSGTIVIPGVETGGDGGGDTFDQATGLNMIVPPGFPNDTFKLPLGLTSGEQVLVLNKQQQLDMQRSMSPVTQSSISNVNNMNTTNNFNLNNSFRNATARSVTDDIKLLQMLSNA